jgi:4-aminobutyrate aminotransferase / (S)-3-amino-2-methylpropionate transaminase / 5-aminovalerate transaminase
MSVQESRPVLEPKAPADWPGPANEGHTTLRRTYVARGVYSAVPIFAARGEGAQLTDVDGHVYIDFAAGIGTLAVGHCHPRVVEAIVRQAQSFSRRACMTT